MSVKVAVALALVAVAICGAAAVTEDDARLKFQQFTRLYERRYGDEEYAYRYGVFKDNLAKIETLNKLSDHATYDINKFADLTEEEFRQSYLGWEVPEELRNAPQRVGSVEVGDIPTSYDWRDHGAVTPVKNQGQCGSCWSFSTTGNIEGQWFLAGHDLTSLSEQQFVDCDKVDQGCNGGLPSNAYQYAIKAGGVESETDYPYTAMDGSCQFDASKVVTTISNWTALPEDEDQLAAWLVQHGPISIGINAEWMQFYAGGVSDPLFCNPKDLDHGVLIVGYGTQDSKPYWIIKNSWGPDWGEKGYYLIIRGKGKCGLNTMATSSIV